MPESLKEEMKRHFGVNESRLEPIPSREISLKEMLSYRAQSEQKLKEKGNRRSGSRKESMGDLSLPCPRCGTINWDQFPDGRGYCLSCGAVLEIDGTVTGGAIKQEISKQINGSDKNMIVCEFTCSGCPEVIQAPGKDIEAAKKKVIPHKAHDPTSQCEGVFTYSRQVFPNPNPALILENNKTEKPNMEQSSGIIERFQHPKLGKFVCNKCPFLNDCSQTYKHTDTCLKISSDLKLKKMIEVLERLLLK